MSADDFSSSGQRLKSARKAANMNQKDWGAEIGVSVNTVVEYEKGNTAPDLKALIRIHQLSGISLDWIATGKEAPQAPINQDILAGVIEAVEQEAGDIDVKTKARLISRLYIDRIKHHSKGIEADSQPKGRTASKP